jgi:hypothetical protein
MVRDAGKASWSGPLTDPITSYCCNAAITLAIEQALLIYSIFYYLETEAS